jgi:hypothetical protein
MLNTLTEFVDRVKELDNVYDAYHVFEEECTDELREDIYNMSEANSAEPFRSAMYNLGFSDY